MKHESGPLLLGWLIKFAPSSDRGRQSNSRWRTLAFSAIQALMM
jgi:hypothetical protein